MRREELLAATQNVLTAFKESGSFEFFRALRTGRSERANHAGMDTFVRFLSLSRAFGPAERHLLQVFDLEVVEAPNFWLEAVVNGGEPPIVRNFAVNLNMMRNFLPKVLSALENDASRAKAAVSQGRTHQDVLTAILIEGPDQASRPARIIDALRSITSLYEVCASLTGTASDSLALVGCDSGSDKSFDFLGASEAMKALKELILELWDRTVFYRETRTENHMNLALKSLSSVEKVSKMQEEKAIDHEQGERLKHQVIANAATFLNCGILIPEISSHTKHDPRLLMAPQPKLLTGSTVAAEPDATTEAAGATAEHAPDERPSRGLSAEEERILQALLEKARQADTSRTDDDM